ncbi:hypothetical protein [uncultured Phocaeicola sp.]|uniref:hypothetical protein n=1 Tax=uncultured Phocaeicola sp. TaxID=990718 RepID=UPI0025AB6384|nr:hypothetical protein [uncultured Phocaeicola sp.]
METLYADGVLHGQPVVIVYVNNGHCWGGYLRANSYQCMVKLCLLNASQAVIFLF